MMGNVVYSEFERPQGRLEWLTIQSMKLFWIIICGSAIIVIGLILLNYLNYYITFFGYRI